VSFDVQDLFRRHSQELKHFLRRRGHNAETAADITQDTFLRVLASPPAEVCPNYNPKAYLYQVSRNLSVNHQRRIAVDFTNQSRRIELLAGMSFFDVAQEPQRPFSVKVADLTATALGTAFDIANDGGMLTVTVDHGTVEARAPDSPIALGAKLQAGEWVTFDRSRRDIERGSREASQIASWRDNFIVAEKEAVSALVARIGRWIPGRIVMADPFIGSQRVSGIYDLNDPKRALEAVVHPAGAHLRQVSSFLTVISPL
jgi:transmembrane sensor